MVITSVNAGLLDDIMWGVGNIQTTLASVFSSSSEILDLMTQVENESSEYRTTMELANLLAKTKLAEGFNSDNSNHQKVMELLDQIDACLIELETLELKYLVNYILYQRIALS
ncbi:hypothetical protein BASA60_006192 [Batrachochytrium salamandrivorans]|nr:hypothetical protein BASA60_006192 [Batrachochytrium salamandrivorans]